MNLEFKEKLFKSTNLNIFLIIFLPISLFAGSLIVNLNVFFIIIFFLMDYKKNNAFSFLKDKNFYFLLIIYSYLILNSIFIAENNDSLVRSLGFIRFILLAFIISYYLNIDDEKYKNKILKYWAYIFLIVTADLIFEAFFKKNILGFSANYSGRLAGFTGDELKIGGYYLGFILLTLSYFYYKNKFTFLVFIFIFIFVALFIGERANFIKIFLASLFFSFFLIEKISYKKILVLFGIVTVLFIFIFNFFPNFKTKSLDKIKAYNPYHLMNIDKNQKIEMKEFLKNNKHFSHYYVAYNIFKKEPFFGIGMKNFRKESGKEKYNTIEGVNGFANHPHQIHFEFLSELGLIGYLLIILNIFYIIIKSFKKSFKKNLFVISATLFIFVNFIPLIPSGSFFTTYTATIFWINYSFLITNSKK